MVLSTHIFEFSSSQLIFWGSVGVQDRRMIMTRLLRCRARMGYGGQQRGLNIAIPKSGFFKLREVIRLTYLWNIDKINCMEALDFFRNLLSTINPQRATDPKPDFGQVH